MEIWLEVLHKPPKTLVKGSPVRPVLSLTTQNMETSEGSRFKRIEDSTKRRVRPAADVLIVQFNILLKCQVASGDCQRDKTDTDRRRDPSLTFIMNIFPLKTSLHLCLISWPGKGHTCPRGQEAHRLGAGLPGYTALTFI